jgi:hypothetical protein
MTVVPFLTPDTDYKLSRAKRLVGRLALALSDYRREPLGPEHHHDAVKMLIDSGVLGEFTEDHFFGTIPW